MRLPVLFRLPAAGVINIEQATNNLGVGLVNDVGEARLGEAYEAYEVYVDEPRKLARHGIEARHGERLDLSIDKRASGGNPFLTLEGGSLSGATRLQVEPDGSIGGPVPASMPGMGGMGSGPGRPGPING